MRASARIQLTILELLVERKLPATLEWIAFECKLAGVGGREGAVAEELEELGEKGLVACRRDGLGTRRWTATDAGAKVLQESV